MTIRPPALFTALALAASVALADSDPAARAGHASLVVTRPGDGVVTVEGAVSVDLAAPLVARVLSDPSRYASWVLPGINACDGNSCRARVLEIGPDPERTELVRVVTETALPLRTRREVALYRLAREEQGDVVRIRAERLPDGDSPIESLVVELAISSAARQSAAARIAVAARAKVRSNLVYGLLRGGTVTCESRARALFRRFVDEVGRLAVTAARSR